MWNPAGELQDAKSVIPDSSYAGVYQVMIEDCKANGAYDPTTMGSVPNVGLMAQGREYGSHDKTFEITTDGTMRVVDGTGAVLMDTPSSRGIGACAGPGAPIKDWVKLAVNRAGPRLARGLLAERGPRTRRRADQKVEAYLPEHDPRTRVPCPLAGRGTDSRWRAFARARTPSR